MLADKMSKEEETKRIYLSSIELEKEIPFG